MDVPNDKRLVEELKKLIDTPGLIIDLRANRDGSFLQQGAARGSKGQQGKDRVLEEARRILQLPSPARN